jgi:hypothetical protein
MGTVKSWRKEVPFKESQKPEDEKRPFMTYMQYKPAMDPCQEGT